MRRTRGRDFKLISENGVEKFNSELGVMARDGWIPCMESLTATPYNSGPAVRYSILLYKEPSCIADNELPGSVSTKTP